MKKWMYLATILAVGIVLVLANLGHGTEAKKAKQPVHILAGIDSLTNGRLYGSNKSRYLDDFIPALKKQYGDGGPGYIPFDTLYFQREGGRLEFSGNLKEINDLPHDVAPAVYSFDFKGLYTLRGQSDFIKMDLNRSFTMAKLFYLEQGGGGSFEAGSGGHFIEVKTNGRTGLGVITLPGHTPRHSLIIRHIRGRVTLFGGYFYNPSGVIVSRVGQGGDRLEWYTGLNQRTLIQWIQALQPDLYIFNGGMNDRNWLSAYRYKASLDMYLTPFLKSHCTLILSIPNAIRGDETRLKAYSHELRLFSKQYHTGLISYQDALGTSYREAYLKGYMADDIHPNAKGASVMSRHLLNYLNHHEVFRALLSTK